MVDAVTDSNGCDVCGGTISPQAFSAGEEYWCDACGTTYLYRHVIKERERLRAEERARFARLPEDLREIISCMDVHDLADAVTDLHEKVTELTASRDEWQTLAGDWETRARRALEGMKGSNNLMHTWRERALSAEDKLRVLTTPRDDDPGDDA